MSLTDCQRLIAEMTDKRKAHCGRDLQITTAKRADAKDTTAPRVLLRRQQKLTECRCKLTLLDTDTTILNPQNFSHLTNSDLEWGMSEAVNHLRDQITTRWQLTPVH